jgi:hypothetical protein
VSARCRRLFAEPVRDYLAALDAMRDRGVAGLVVASVAFALAWFVYVPIHELFHAWGCLLAGGTVTRLEIAPEYGGALLARSFRSRLGSAYGTADRLRYRRQRRNLAQCWRVPR